MGNPATQRFTGSPPTTGHPLVALFRALARDRQFAVHDIADRAGISSPTISAWSTTSNPTVPTLDAALGVIGCELAIIDSKTGEVVRPPVTSTNANARGSR